MERTSAGVATAAVMEGAVSLVVMIPARHPRGPNAPGMTISSRVMNAKHMVMVLTNVVVVGVEAMVVVAGLAVMIQVTFQMARSAVDHRHRHHRRHHRQRPLQGMAAAHGPNQAKFRNAAPRLHIARQMPTIANSVVVIGSSQWRQKP